MIVTQWFPMSECPIYVGIYHMDSERRTCYSYWNGDYWGLISINVSDAYLNRHVLSEGAYNGYVAGWRGLFQSNR